MKKHGLCLMTGAVFFLFCFSAPARPEEPEKKLGLFPEDRISAEELRQQQLQFRNVVIVDARDEASYQASHIRDAIFPGDDHTLEVSPGLQESMSRYSKDTMVVTYCDTGCQASAVMALKIKRMGFQNVKTLEDGFQTWQDKGYPVKK